MNKINELWNKQENSNVPDVATVIAQANLFKKKNMRRVLFANISLVSTAVFMFLVCYLRHPAMMTTTVGTALGILSVLFYLIAANQVIPLLKNVSLELSGSEYLQKLTEYKRKELLMNKVMTNIYYILLATGISLYMIESTAGKALNAIIITYALPLGWIAYSWFFKMPRRIKNRRDELNDMINNLREISRQMQA